jgi:hypothetical protein
LTKFLVLVSNSLHSLFLLIHFLNKERGRVPVSFSNSLYYIDLYPPISRGLTRNYPPLNASSCLRIKEEENRKDRKVFPPPFLCGYAGGHGLLGGEEGGSGSFPRPLRLRLPFPFLSHTALEFCGSRRTRYMQTTRRCRETPRYFAQAKCPEAKPEHARSTDVIRLLVWRGVF